MAINLTATNAEVIEEINRKDIFTDGTGLGTAAVTTSPYSCAKWVGNNPAIKSLFTGLIVWHKIGVAGNGSYGTSLNINNLGEHPVVTNVNTMVSTRYAVGCIIPLIYDADGTGSLYLNSASATTVTGVWKIADYDTNTTITYGTLAYYLRPYTAAALYRYKLCAMTIDNKLLPLITTNNTAAATNLTPTATAFRPDKIYWYNTTTTINANAVVGANTLMSNGYNATNIAICNFNTSLPTYRYVYLCGTYDTTTGLFTLNGGGTAGSTAYYTFVPDNTSNITLSSYFTSGKDYILLGASYSTANYMHLREDNLLFHFDGTNLVPYDTYRVNSLGTAATKNTGTSSGNIPVLDSNGKLADSVIPAVAITDTFTASSQAAMLALTAEKGDVCIRTDLNKSFILSTNSPSTLADWKELLTPTGGVTSVNGKTGAVTLTASDVSALPSSTVIPTKTSQLTNDSAFVTASAVPTKTSDLTNDSGYITSSDIPDVSDMVTKSGNQTISGTKTFDSTDTYISGFGVSKTNNLGNNGYYAFVRGNSSNPLFGLRYGSTNYYLQVSASGLQLGPTSTVATTWASNGDVTMQGTNRPKWKTSNLALQSEIPTVDTVVSGSSNNPISNAAIKNYVDENKSTIHESKTTTATYNATYNAYICGVDAETFYEGKHCIFVVIFSAGAEPDLTKPIYFVNTLDNSMMARVVTPTTLLSQGTPISVLAKQCYYAYPYGGSASAVLSFTGTTTQVLRLDWDIIVDTPNLSNLPEASTSTAGVVTTGEQTFSGNKYFSNNIYSYGSDGLVAGLATNTKYKSGEINNRGFALTLPLKQGTLATLDDIPPNAGVPELTDATIRIYDLDYGIYRWNYNGQKYVNPYGQSGTSTQAVGTASTNNFLVYVYNGFQMVFGGACKSYIIFASNTSTNPALATPYLYYGDCSLSANATMGSCNYGQFNPVTANDTSATAGTLTSINIGGTNYAVGGGGSSSAGVYVSSYINPAATSLVSISNVSLQPGQTLKVGDLVIGKKGTSASSAVSGTLVISKVTSIISSYYNCSIEYDSTALTTSSVTSGSTALVTSGGVYTAIQNAITTALNNSY